MSCAPIQRSSYHCEGVRVPTGVVTWLFQFQLRDRGPPLTPESSM